MTAVRNVTAEICGAHTATTWRIAFLNFDKSAPYARVQTAFYNVRELLNAYASAAQTSAINCECKCCNLVNTKRVKARTVMVNNNLARSNNKRTQFSAPNNSSSKYSTHTHAVHALVKISCSSVREPKWRVAAKCKFITG